MTTSSQYFANIGVAQIFVANTALDGTGPMSLVYTAGNTANSIGSIIKKIIIKATGDTNQGMIRLFINNGTTTNLFMEISVPGTTQTSVVPAFSVVDINTGTLQAGYTLYAATQNAESFNVIIVGTDIVNCECS